MLYKNKIKVQNILKSAVALMLMLTLSLSTALSPLAKAEEARYTWKTLTSVPGPDGSKLFAMERDAAHNTTDLWMSADDGTTWRKIFSKQILVTTFMGGVSISTDGSKIVLRDGDYFGISTDGGQSWIDKGPEPEDVMLVVVLLSLQLTFLLTTVRPGLRKVLIIYRALGMCLTTAR